MRRSEAARRAVYYAALKHRDCRVEVIRRQLDLRKESAVTTASHDPRAVLAGRLQTAVAKAFGAEHANVDPMVRRSERADFQADLAMGLAKALKRPPRQVAEAVVAAADFADIAERVEIAGPGFINVTLKREFLESALQNVARDERLGVPRAVNKERVVIDYSAPNVAKEMHVGHLRSTIIGDALARLLEFAGHDVIRQNHIGDWGTPFGMLIEHLLDVGEGGAQDDMGELSDFYRAARAKFDSDPGFADRARQRVVLLQAGDARTLELWRQLVDLSKRYFSTVYQRLGIGLRDEHVRGESAYNAVLAGNRGRAREERARAASTTAHCARFRRGSRIAKASRCRSSSASRTAAMATAPRISRHCGTARRRSAVRGCSTSSARRRRSISPWCSPSARRPAG